MAAPAPNWSTISNAIVHQILKFVLFSRLFILNLICYDRLDRAEVRKGHKFLRVAAVSEQRQLHQLAGRFLLRLPVRH